MYLVHARLTSEEGMSLPEEAAAVFASCAGTDDGVEHVVVHPDQPTGPVVGLFMAAGSLAAAERSALDVCLRAVTSHEALSGFRVDGLGAVLVPGPWDVQTSPQAGRRQHPGPRSDPAPCDRAPGPLMPMHNPSRTNPFHPF